MSRLSTNRIAWGSLEHGSGVFVELPAEVGAVAQELPGPFLRATGFLSAPSCLLLLIFIIRGQHSFFLVVPPLL